MWPNKPGKNTAPENEALSDEEWDDKADGWCCKALLVVLAIAVPLTWFVWDAEAPARIHALAGHSIIPDAVLEARNTLRQSVGLDCTGWVLDYHVNRYGVCAWRH